MGVKSNFQNFMNISESSGWILLPLLAFWKLFILPSCTSEIRNDFKGPLTTYIILNFKKCNFQFVKQRANEFADPLIILLSIFEFQC